MAGVGAPIMIKARGWVAVGLFVTALIFDHAGMSHNK